MAKGWGTVLGGLLAIPTGGASLALGIGADLAGAAISSNAAKKAARTQSRAADRALAVQQQAYQQHRQDFSPYLQQGTQAIGRMGEMATAPRMTFNPNQPQQLGNLGNPTGFPAPGPTAPLPPVPLAQAPWQQQAEILKQKFGSGPGPNMSGQPPASVPPSQGQMVLMQAPDGSRKAYPAHEVPKLVAAGARVIQ